MRLTKFVGVLKRQWLLYDLLEHLPPTCWPFIIPKTSEKVSLILSFVKQNGLDGCTPPRFSLRSWEQLSKLLVTFYPGVPLYGTHIDLKNAFWSFVLPESARTVFRPRSGPSGRVVGLGRLPFGWKYSPFICQQTLVRIVGRMLPPDILLVHYLDDFLLIHHDKRYLRDHTGNTVLALGREGFIISPKSVLKLATQLLFWASGWTSWYKWCGRMRWPTCRCWWPGSGWRFGDPKRGSCNPFWESCIGRFGLGV